MTVHKAQGQTLGRVIVDLAGCTGTEPPYVMCLRATCLDGLAVLWDFNDREITKRRSEGLQIEFTRLMNLKWMTTAKYGNPDEIEGARQVLNRMRKGSGVGVKRKFKGKSDGKKRPKRLESGGSGWDP